VLKGFSNNLGQNSTQFSEESYYVSKKLTPSYPRTPKNSPLYTNKENIQVFNHNKPLII